MAKLKWWRPGSKMAKLKRLKTAKLKWRANDIVTKPNPKARKALERIACKMRRIAMRYGIHYVSMIGRIMEKEVLPFIEDVQTLATSMANLYKEHAAHFILLGVKVNIEVQVMDKPALKSQVGSNIFDENDINRVVHEDAEEHEDDAAAPVQ